MNFLRYYFTLLPTGCGTHVAKRDMLFEQIAEIVRILITDVKRNIAHAAVAIGQQMLCRLDADSGQIFDKGLTGLL